MQISNTQKIEKKDIETILALTSIQEGMLFHYLMNPERENYFEQLCLELYGHIDTNYFERSWNVVIQTNEMLRTVFRWEKVENPVQIILNEYKLQPVYFDLSTLSQHAIEEKIQEIKENSRKRPFDLRNVAFRVILCKLSPDKYEMIICNHHILYDGWSTGIILKEFFTAYNDFSRGKHPVKPVKTGFKEFVRWARTPKAQNDNDDIFWRDYLNGYSTQAELSIKRKIKGKQTGYAEKMETFFEHDRQAELDGFLETHRITLASLLYSAWGIMLQKYTNTDDVIFGSTVAGRTAKVQGIEDVVGLFINTLPLRVRTESRQTIVHLLHEINDSLHSREDFERSSLVEIKNYCEIGKEEELFDTLVVIENYPLDLRALSDNSMLKPGKFSVVEIPHYDLSVGIATGRTIEVKIIFNTMLFESSAIERLMRHFKYTIDFILAHPSALIEDVDMLSEEERKTLLEEFNLYDHHGKDFLADQTIHGLFAEQVRRIPDRMALVEAPVQLTFQKLDEISSGLSSWLHDQEIHTGDIVGIMVDRSIEMIVGILGILKTGAAYLPLNPKQPETRTQYMLRDSEAKLLLTSDTIKRVINDVHGNFSPMREVSPQQYAYIIYTSGSTGNPKGVPIRHSNFSPLIHWGYWNLQISEKDRAIQNLAYYFDWSVWEIFIALTSGAALHMVSAEMLLDPMASIDYMNQHAITIIHATPTQFSYFVGAKRKLETLTYLFIGAEKLTQELVKRSFDVVNKDCRVFNMYGPTEATIISAVLEIPRSDANRYDQLTSVPIGKPSGNLNLLVLDRNYHLCPIGVSGELYIEGDGVANGYLNRPELSAEKFFCRRPGSFLKKNSWIDKEATPDRTFSMERIYRTGDLARWVSDGLVEFLGRTDYQVKIRGFRIEPGEIENLLLNHETIKEAVVVARDDASGDKYLCAYIVPKIPGNLDIPSLKDFLEATLPVYMIPSSFVELERIPLNPNGKVDTRALPEPSLKKKAIDTETWNETQQKLLKVWLEVLSSDSPVGLDDSFFEIGGHSLKATRLVSRIHKEMNVIVPLQEIFISPTIRLLAEYIDGVEHAAKNIYASIEPVGKKSHYVLSSSQKRIYILQQMEKSSVTYNMSRAVLLEGDLNGDRILEAVFQKLIDRHESLRTSFEMVEEEPVQTVHDLIQFEMERIEWRQKNTDIASIIKSFIRPFDLSHAPLMRVGLAELEEKKYILIVDMHHIVSDGMSTGIFIKDFIALYQGEMLPPLKFHYKDYSEWQHALWTGKPELKQKQEGYWLKQFESEVPVLGLPLDYSRPVVQSFEGGAFHFNLGPGQAEALNKLIKDKNTTLFIVLTAVYDILLTKLSGQEDIVLGTVAAGRRHTDLEPIIGMFVNTLALRSFPRGEKTFTGFLNEVEKTTLNAFENQDYPFEELVDKLVKTRDSSRNPLFDTVFVLQDLDIPSIELPGLTLTPIDYESGISKFDLIFICEKREDTLYFTIEYGTKLFKEETIERFSVYYKRLISSILEAPEQRISEFEIITETEKIRIMEDFNHKETEYVNTKTLHGLFEEQVERTPDHMALTGVPVQLTYRELNEVSTSFANQLYHEGIRSGDIVGIQIERSIEMIIGILGILKTGSTYLPINPKQPEARTDYMMRDSRARLLITADHLNDVRTKQPSHDLNAQPTYCPSSLAYVIYTSGSTGNPKGVPIQHSNFSSLIHWGYRNLGIGTADRFVQNLSYYFDWSVWEIFLSLTTGAALYMITDKVLLDPVLEVDFICRNRITVLHITPTQYQYLVNVGQKMDSMRYLFIGAEKMTLDIVKRSIESVTEDCRIFNMYGPTEATIISAVLEINRSTMDNYKELTSVPIGRASGNLDLLVLDHYLNMCPVGITGELYIRGDGVARGYLNQPELTGERFVTTKKFLRGSGAVFSKKAPGFILYKTGDLVRWIPEGTIEYLGRIDQQVKIRGYRIELGEIENRILDHASIRDAIVIDRESEAGEKYLCAYVVPMDPEELTHSDVFSKHIRDYLAKGLPDYMIPSYFVLMEQIPLNPNGKIDRRALPEPAAAGKAEGEAPSDAVEAKLVNIWTQVLGMETPIGVTNNFFESGGHSLKASILVAKINHEMGTALSLVDIFIKPTIRELAAYLRGMEPTVTNAPSVPPLAEKRDYYMVSSSQKRLYILQQLNKEDMTYHMYNVMALEGKVDKERMERTFQRLIERHESFRTSFEMREGMPVQIIHETVEFAIEYLEVSEVNEDVLKNMIRPFDLTQAPLLRATLIKTGEDRYLMAVDMHHIVSDGTSVGIFSRDFMALYNGEKLAPLRVQYKDFSAWQDHEVRKQMIEKQGEYWMAQLNGNLPVLELPYDFPRPQKIRFEGSRVEFDMDRDRTEALKKLARDEDVTLYMVLMGAYKVLLSKLSWSEDIIVGTPAAGRGYDALQSIIGMFINTVALRTFPMGDKVFVDYLKEIKIKALEAFENQDYPFEDLADKLVPDRDTSHNPLFDTMFTLQNIDIPEIEIPGLKLNLYDYNLSVSRFDMSWIASEREGNLHFVIEFSTALFREERIKRFVEYFNEIITVVLNNRNIRIKDIDVTPGLVDSVNTIYEEASGDFGF
ncbi:MAG: amino acid adenylation domain-containing protein [Candidatus Omnitrophota bacterium]